MPVLSIGKAIFSQKKNKVQMGYLKV